MKFISNIPKELSANNLIARISHDEFAILFHTHEISKIEQYFQDLQISLDLTNKNLKSFEKLLCFSIGIAPYYENDKLSEALSRVDYSLSRSKINGCNLVDIYQENEQNHALITLGKNSWKQMFEKIFNDKRIVLAMQSTLNKERDEKFHDEVLVRIKEDDGSLQTAGYYLPMANALGLIAKFDHNVIGSVVEKIATYSYPVAINISKDFIVQSLYFLELRNTLSALRKSNPQMLHFECSEHDILLELESYIEFSDMLHAHNQSFGIDRFSGIENIGYIKKLRPDYIKINVNFILESHDNNAAILNTLNILSQTMGITLIITAVQSKEQFEKLQEIGYKNFQGHFIADIVLT
jgi:EAL domain-containing protein (putative c-di-GMP-specific phosphodiesterase class I)